LQWRENFYFIAAIKVTNTNTPAKALKGPEATANCLTEPTFAELFVGVAWDVFVVLEFALDVPPVLIKLLIKVDALVVPSWQARKRL
jgi:hypothetical protein